MRVKFLVREGDWHTKTTMHCPSSTFWFAGDFSYNPMKFLRAWLKK